MTNGGVRSVDQDSSFEGRENILNEPQTVDRLEARDLLLRAFGVIALMVISLLGAPPISPSTPPRRGAGAPTPHKRHALPLHRQPGARLAARLHALGADPSRRVAPVVKRAHRYLRASPRPGGGASSCR